MYKQKHSLHAHCLIVNVRACVLVCAQASLRKYIRIVDLFAFCLYFSATNVVTNGIIHYFCYRIEEISNNLYFQTARRKRFDLESERAGERESGQAQKIGKRVV